MKKISDATIKKICNIDAEKLASKKIIQPARNGGYCCPMPDCSNGTGRDGTGIYPKNNNGYQHWWCPVCKENFNNLRIFSVHYGLDLKSDFNQLVEKICADFDIDIEFDTSESPRTSRKRRKKNATKAEPVNPAELELISADLNTSPDDLTALVKFSGYCKDGKWRGLPIDFLLKYGCRYIAQWIHPKIRVAQKKSTATSRILIPCSPEGYLSRLINPIEEFDEQTRQHIREKEHAGRKTLFNAADLNSGEVVIAVEGYIDCLSLIYTGFKSVALGGANETAKLVDAVAKMPVKPKIVILMDADATGRKAAPTLYAELINLGCPCCVRFLSEEESKIDCNDMLIRNGEEFLRGRIESMIVGALSELDAVTRELEERSLRRHDDALIDFLFKGDSSDLDFARRIEKFCGDDVRWLTDDKEWMLYERNEHRGGLWRRAGEQNACLLPRVREMADVMLEFADNKDERELAEKLKRTRKNLSAITMLKSLDSILITAEDLDKHAELLNVRNGVINLETGELMKAAPELLLSQQAAAVYNPKCTDTTFADFLQSILPDDETRFAVTSYLGYCLTGDVSAEKFLMIHGRGGNGKGVLLLTLRTLLSDYACELPVDTVLESKSKFSDATGRATAEITPLVNRRAGIVDELPRNARFDVAKVNRLTGRDYLPVRELHHEYKDVPPTHKLILTGNFRPQIDDTRDAALLRRLIVVNFTQDFTQNPDVTLKDKLLANSALSGALNILVADAVEFYKRGKLLEPSPLMKRAREDFLGENDFIGDFLSEYYEFGTSEEFALKRKDLLKHLRDQCADAARYRDADLINMLAKVDGVTYTKDRTNANIFKGIRRATKQDAVAAKDDFEGEFLFSADYVPPI